MSRRAEFSKATKLAAWERCAGICECGCGQQILGTPDYDHVIEAALGGSNDLDNCRVLSKRCRRMKTSDRSGEVAKSIRGFEKRIGIRSKRTVMAGSRASKWKRKMDGTVIRR